MKYYFKCPSCKNNDQFTVPSESSSGLGCLLLFLGGIIPALLYASATTNRIQCGNCGHIFRQPPLPNSPVSKLSKSLILIMILFIFSGFLFVIEPEFGSVIPKYEWLTGLENIIASNPYVVAFFLVAFVLVLSVITVMTSMISNAKFRSNFRKEHKTQPEQFSQIRKRNANQKLDPTVKTPVESGNEQGTAGQL
jgi:rubredoxin